MRLITGMAAVGVAPAPPPRVEGIVTLPGGRLLGYAEFGPPDGSLIIWCHGTPGARRQVPGSARRAAEEYGFRIVCVERPGVGGSTDHVYADLRGWAADVAVVADRLGCEEFTAVGLSGGGPYALACAHELPDRVAAVGLLGSLVPTAGADALAGGLVGLAHSLNPLLTAMRRPFGLGLWAFLRLATPLGGPVYGLYARITTEGDRRVLTDPELRSIFIDDLATGGRRQFQAVHNDLVLLGRPWGFRLVDVNVPVRWWHGDKDPFVPLEEAQRAAAILPDVELIVRPDESHLGGFAAGDDVLKALAQLRLM
jgi:pimeloyl-ACP methyl ester carboxylesterase